MSAFPPEFDEAASRIPGTSLLVARLIASGTTGIFIPNLKDAVMISACQTCFHSNPDT